MFTIDGCEAQIRLRSQKEIDEISTRLGERGYRGLLGSVVNTLCDTVGVPEEGITTDQILNIRPYLRRRRESQLIGEIFFRGNHCFILRPRQDRIQIWGIRSHIHESKLAEFGQDLEEVVRGSIDERRLKGMKFDWEPLAPAVSARGRHWAEEEDAETAERRLGEPPDYDDVEKEGAFLLQDSTVRSFALRLAQIQKIRASDAQDLDPEALISHSIMRKEYLVSCKEDSHTITIVPNRMALQGGEFKCPVCGRRLQDEIVHEIYLLTEQGRSLLKGSRWMSIWITELLKESGVDLSSLLWNIEVNGEELDIMLEMWGMRIFFELKDREFGLGDAYPFVYRVSRYDGDWGVVVTTERVAKDARRFLEEQGKYSTGTIGPVPHFELIEGEKEIPQEIKKLVNSLSKFAALRLFTWFTEGGLNIAPIVNSWLDLQSKKAS